jgi:hypothetical protein
MSTIQGVSGMQAAVEMLRSTMTVYNFAPSIAAMITAKPEVIRGKCTLRWRRYRRRKERKRSDKVYRHPATHR